MLLFILIILFDALEYSDLQQDPATTCFDEYSTMNKLAWIRLHFPIYNMDITLVSN